MRVRLATCDHRTRLDRGGEIPLADRIPLLMKGAKAGCEDQAREILLLLPRAILFKSVHLRRRFLTRARFASRSYNFSEARRSVGAMETRLLFLSFTRADVIVALVVGLLSVLLVGGLQYELMSNGLVRPPASRVEHIEPYP